MKNNNKKVKTLTLDDIDKFIESQIKKINNDSDFMMMQGCKTKGLVYRSRGDLNLCSDPDCSSCSMFRNL